MTNRTDGPEIEICSLIFGVCGRLSNTRLYPKHLHCLPLSLGCRSTSLLAFYFILSSSVTFVAGCRTPDCLQSTSVVYHWALDIILLAFYYLLSTRVTFVAGYRTPDCHHITSIVYHWAMDMVALTFYLPFILFWVPVSPTDNTGIWNANLWLRKQRAYVLGFYVSVSSNCFIVSNGRTNWNKTFFAKQWPIL